MEGLHSPACEKHEANGSTKRGENNKETMKNEGKNEKRQRNSHARRARIVISHQIQEQSGAGGQKGSTRSTTTTFCQNHAHAYTRAPFLIVPKSKNSVRVSRGQNRALRCPHAILARNAQSRAPPLRRPFRASGLERAARGLGAGDLWSPQPLPLLCRSRCVPTSLTHVYISLPPPTTPAQGGGGMGAGAGAGG